MDRRITIALVVILALLAGYIWYTFLRADAPPLVPETPEPTAIPFLSLPSDQVQAIQVLDTQTKQTTRVVRDGEEWKMEQPAQGQANRVRVERVLFELSRITAERKLTPTGDLAVYGLNPAAYQVRTELKDGSTVTFQLGGENPDKDYFYALKNGDAAVYLIDASIANDLVEFATLPPFTPTPEPTESPSPTPTP